MQAPRTLEATFPSNCHNLLKMQDIKDVFAYLDSDKSGLIDLKTLPVALRCMGLNPTDVEINEFCDDIKSEKIGLEELKTVWEKCKAQAEGNREEVLKFLKSLDKEEVGTVEVEELKNALMCGAEALDGGEVEMVLKDFVQAGETRVRIDDLIEGLFKGK